MPMASCYAEVLKEKMLTGLLIHCFLSINWSFGLNEHLRGHLKPFGNHREPEIVTDELLFVPDPTQFWEQYVSKNRPVVFREAAKHSRAFELWTEEYLIEQYGNLTLRLESRSESNHRLPTGGDGILGRDSVRHFLQNYQNVDAYVISQIPQPMERDIAIPPCLRCGSFVDSIQEVHLFLSALGGQTKLHQDPYNNIHCIFNGTKDWLLVHPDQTHLIYMSDESEFEWGGYSEINADSVDLEIFPRIKEVQFSKVTMNKGDCIFMPGGYWHQVRSWGYMNSAVAIWFSQLKQFSQEGCDKQDQIAFTPMNQVPILWRYSGHGSLSQGHMDVHILRRFLLTLADGEGKIRLDNFVDQFFNSESDNKREIMKLDEQKRAKALVAYLDPDDKGFITKEYLQNLSIDQLKDILLFIDPNDVSNTEELEYSHIEALDIERLLVECYDSQGIFDEEKFISHYMEDLGGTHKKAWEIVENLRAANKDVSLADPASLIPQVLHKFYSSRVHDPTFERKMYQHLHQHDEL
ncbi:Bifunctional peptidase and arginyl-hydroxylase JMJD5 [Acropora cervicornis]|uniref:Bifunctional peptidase and arginyl-hydroxylase JMJD5 n=1 Tax=Acropora cervicornis TaxID=6130 RepID=A0AAD9PRH6_ACRCE|nr:Bifunctional peptidase and arginyl-hydroxylase JMJD5 [Acropora cervicornis]